MKTQKIETNKKPRIGMYGELDMVTTGKMQLSMMSDRIGETHIWVQKIDEEGGEFYGDCLKELDEFIEKWFDKHF